MKGRKLRQVEGESRRGGGSNELYFDLHFQDDYYTLFGGRRIFICAKTRIIFVVRANNLYHTFPVSNWNLSFRVLRFNNLRKQVSIFLKVPPSPLSLLCTTSGVHRAYSRETNRIG